MVLLVAVITDQVVDRQVARVVAREPILGGEGGPVILHWSDVYQFGTVERFVVAGSQSGFPTPPGLSRLPEQGEAFVSPALADMLAEESLLASSIPGRVVGRVEDTGLRYPNELAVWVGVDPDRIEGLPASGWGDRSRIPELLLGSYRWFYVGTGLIVVLVPILMLVALAARTASKLRIEELWALRALGMSSHQLGFVLGSGFVSPALLGSLAGLAITPSLIGFIARRDIGQLGFFVEDAGLTTGLAIATVFAVLLAVVLVAVVTVATVFRSPIPLRPTLALSEPSRFGWWLLGSSIVLMIIVGSPIAMPPVAALLLVFIAATAAVVGLAVGTTPTTRWLGARSAVRSKRVVGLVTARRLESASGSNTRLAAALGVGLFVFSFLGPAELVLGGDHEFEQAVLAEQEANGRSLIQVETSMQSSLETMSRSPVQAVLPMAKVFDPGTGEPLGDSILVTSCPELVKIALSDEFVCPDGVFQISSDGSVEVSPWIVAKDAKTGESIRFDVTDGVVDLALPADDNLGGAVVVPADLAADMAPNGLATERYLLMIDPGPLARDEVRALIAGVAPSALIIDAVDVNIGGSQRLIPLLTFLRVSVAAGLLLLTWAISLVAIDVLSERTSQLKALRIIGVPIPVLHRLQTASIVVPGVLSAFLATGLAIALDLSFRARLGLPPSPTLTRPLGALVAVSCVWVFWGEVTNVGLARKLEPRSLGTRDSV